MKKRIATNKRKVRFKEHLFLTIYFESDPKIISYVFKDSGLEEVKEYARSVYKTNTTIKLVRITNNDKELYYKIF